MTDEASWPGPTLAQTLDALGYPEGARVLEYVEKSEQSAKVAEHLRALLTASWERERAYEAKIAEIEAELRRVIGAAPRVVREALETLDELYALRAAKVQLVEALDAVPNLVTEVNYPDRSALMESTIERLRALAAGLLT